MYYNNFFFSNAIECKHKFEDTKEKGNDFNDHEYGRLVLPFFQLTFAITCVCFFGGYRVFFSVMFIFPRSVSCDRLCLCLFVVLSWIRLQFSLTCISYIHMINRISDRCSLRVRKIVGSSPNRVKL